MRQYRECDEENKSASHAVSLHAVGISLRKEMARAKLCRRHAQENVVVAELDWRTLCSTVCISASRTCSGRISRMVGCMVLCRLYVVSMSEARTMAIVPPKGPV